MAAGERELSCWHVASSRVYIIYVSKNLARALLELKAEAEAAKNKNNSKAAKAEQD